MMRFTECLGRDVVTTSDAATIGTVAGFVVDPSSSRVAALVVDGGDQPIVAWEDLASFGQDVVTLESRSAARSPEPGIERRTVDGDVQVVGARVLTDAGVEVGHVGDVEFDQADGRVVTVITDREQLDGGRLIGIGSYAVVVARP